MLRRLLTGHSLSEPEAESLFEDVLTGKWDDAQIGAMLSLISSRGPTVDELVGGARVMRRHVTRIETPVGSGGAVVIDTCGTGGAPKTFNVSTIGALVTAAAGRGRVLVAKHGSTSRTGRGSAELMERLGVNVNAARSDQVRCLTEVGVCFAFAVHHHPAMKHAASARRSLGFPTIFNLLGPLTNPAGVRRQLIGTYDRELAAKVAETMARLGTDRTIVVTSHDGLDELSTTSTNVMHVVEHGRVVTRVIDATDLGLARVGIDELRVADLDEAVRAAEEVLEGRRGPRLDIVLLNAAASLVVGGLVEEMGEGLSLARVAVESGAAMETLESLRRVSKQGKS